MFELRWMERHTRLSLPPDIQVILAQSDISNAFQTAIVAQTETRMYSQSLCQLSFVSKLSELWYHSLDIKCSWSTVYYELCSAWDWFLHFTWICTHVCHREYFMQLLLQTTWHTPECWIISNSPCIKASYLSIWLIYVAALMPGLIGNIHSNHPGYKNKGCHGQNMKNKFSTILWVLQPLLLEYQSDRAWLLASPISKMDNCAFYKLCKGLPR